MMAEGETVYAVSSLLFVMDYLERIVMKNKISLARTISIIQIISLICSVKKREF